MTSATDLLISGAMSLGAGGLVYLALKERLRETFQTKEAATAAADLHRRDVDAVGEKVTASLKVAELAIERADSAHELAEAVKLIQEQQWERLTESVVRPLHQVAAELTAQGKLLSGLTEAVNTLKAAK